MENQNEVPPNADKLLFALDLLIFLIEKRCPELLETCRNLSVAQRIELYRSFVHKGFTKEVKENVDAADDEQRETVVSHFGDIKNRDGINLNAFVAYTVSAKYWLSYNQYYLRNFVSYCARIASLACLFISEKMYDAFGHAIECISSNFPFNMNNETWTEFQSIIVDSRQMKPLKCFRGDTNANTSESDGNESSTNDDVHDIDSSSVSEKNNNTGSSEWRNRPSTSATPDIVDDTETMRVREQVSNLELAGSSSGDEKGKDPSSIRNKNLEDKDGYASSSSCYTNKESTPERERTGAPVTEEVEVPVPILTLDLLKSKSAAAAEEAKNSESSQDGMTISEERSKSATVRRRKRSNKDKPKKEAGDESSAHTDESSSYPINPLKRDHHSPQSSDTDAAGKMEVDSVFKPSSSKKFRSDES